MPYKYSCFISYTTGQREFLRRIVTDLDEALGNELDARTDAPVFVARERLEGGDLPEKVISEALCKSVCMVVVFTPRYFDPNATYCAREYRAMESLEAERFGKLGIAGDVSNGLIIPVIFRGWNHFPGEIKERRQCYNFDSFTMADRQMSQHPKYSRKFKKMADYIYNRCLAFKGQDGLFSGCGKYRLPSDDDVRDWAAKLAPQAPSFPSLQVTKG